MKNLLAACFALSLVGGIYAVTQIVSPDIIRTATPNGHDEVYVYGHAETVLHGHNYRYVYSHSDGKICGKVYWDADDASYIGVAGTMNYHHFDSEVAAQAAVEEFCPVKE